MKKHLDHDSLPPLAAIGTGGVDYGGNGIGIENSGSGHWGWCQAIGAGGWHGATGGIVVGLWLVMGHLGRSWWATKIHND